jgi:protease-4
MPRATLAALGAALLAVPAAAQVSNGLDRAEGLPAGLVLPVQGAASAEEPTAIHVNPAGVGFVRDLALLYFHEWDGTPGSQADGLYAATSLGPLATGLSLEWIRPGESGPSRYRKTKLALGLTDGHSASVAAAWNWTDSPGPSLDGVGGWDLGLSWRPSRHLALGASAAGLDARLDGERLPVRYDLGLATRFRDDTFTISADLLADDRGGEDFRPTHLALGAGAEWRSGLALSVQVLVPVRDDPSVPDEVSTVFSVAWNARRGGILGGGAALPGTNAWLAGARLSSEAYRGPEPGALVPLVDLDEALHPPSGPLGLLRRADPYLALVHRLERARDDRDVAGLVLVTSDLSVGLGRIEELRGLLARIRTRKPVLVYLRGGRTKEYLLAAAATEIAAPPSAPIFVNGLATSTLYLRDGLARLGVAFDVVRAGAFKSAPEPLVRSSPSPEAREQRESVLDDAFARVVEAVVQGRRLPELRVRQLLDRGVFTAEEARAAGLLDAVLWPDEIEEWVRRHVGFRPRLARGWDPIRPRAAQAWGRPAAIAVVPLEGTIVPGLRRVGSRSGAEGTARAIRRAAADRDVRAIVLRVDSPGGDGLASDLLWREVMRARKKGKPVVAWAGDVAASGGYLVASAADAIVAQPSTLTGSIGVFALKPDLSGLLGKLSLSRDASRRGESAEIFSPARPWSPRERELLQAQIEALYGIFLDRVAESRGLARSEVEALAAGRVWTGRQAFDRRLVDRLGTFADAVALAREKAGIGPADPVELRRFPAGPGLLGRLAAEALAEAGFADEGSAEGLLRTAAALPEVEAAAALAEMGPVVALPPEWVEPLAHP